MTTNSKEYQKRYYEKNKEKIKASQRAYYKKQRELKLHKPSLGLFNSNFKEQVRKEFKAIPQTELTYSQRYYAENREHICELQKKNRLAKKRKERLSKSFLGRIYLKIFG